MCYRKRFKIIKVNFQKVLIFEIRVHELLLAIEVRINKHSKFNNAKIAIYNREKI